MRMEMIAAVAQAMLADTMRVHALPYEGPGCARIIELDALKPVTTERLASLTAEEREDLCGVLRWMERDVRESLWAEATEEAKQARAAVEDELIERAKDYEYAAGLAADMAAQDTPRQAIATAAEYASEGDDDDSPDEDDDEPYEAPGGAGEAIDFDAEDRGSVWLMRPLTEEAITHAAVVYEDAPRMGVAVAIEHRLVSDNVTRLLSDGYRVSVDGVEATLPE